MTEIPSTPPVEPGEPRRGIRASAQRVAAHARALVRLERELARSELQRKGGMLGAGTGIAVAAGLLAPFAVGFGLAAVAAALALVVDWWLSLLIVFVLLVVVVVILVLVARALFQRATPLKPEQAIEEARLTKQRLRSRRAG
ncbi:MAG TPA: phage holin family protein [Gaiellaceae bacterium]|nr:phage holin family protein [Gaiellaceae bacterium]